MRTVKILSLVMILSLASCDRKEFFRSYVASYYDVSGIRLEERANIGDSKAIGIWHAGDRAFIGNYLSTGSEKVRYDALCVKHNDMGYNRMRMANRPDEITTDYLGMDFVAIRVTSDADFDGEHPAGADLGGIIRYAYYSPKKYIDSGYKSEFDWDIVEGIIDELYGGSVMLNGSLHPVDKLVSELAVDDLVLLGPGNFPYLGTLLFERRPSLSQAHRLTITMTTDEGVELSASIDMDF